MGLVQNLKNKPEEKKKKGDFMQGLKDWITSPGGIITLIMIAGVIFWVQTTKEEKK